MLENAAAESGRSLTYEIEYRLWRSEIDEDARREELEYKFGDQPSYAIALAMAIFTRQLSDQMFAHWTENEYVFQQVREAFDTFLDAIAPPAGAAATGGRNIDPVPKSQISGKDLAKSALEFIGSIGEMDDETKNESGRTFPEHNLRRIAFEVEPAIAPLIGRREKSK